MTDIIVFGGFAVFFLVVAAVTWLKANTKTHTQEWRDSRLVAWLRKDLPDPTPPVSWDYVERRVADALKRNRTLRIDDIVNTAQYADIEDPVLPSLVRWSSPGGTEKVES